MTVLANKEQTMSRAIVLAGVPTHGTHLTRVVGIHPHGHAPSKGCFVSDHALQLSKRPFGRLAVGFALLLARLLAALSLGPFADTVQVFQSDHRLGMCLHQAFGDGVVRIQLQPSLSSTDLHQPAFGGTSAFLLKSLLQAGIMIGFGTGSLARIESRRVLSRSTDREIALPDIHTDYCGVALRRWVC